MNINGITPKIEYRKQDNAPKQPKFGQGFASFLRFLDTNKAWGATGVDLGFMVIPRTIVDSSRGANAGIETGVRETSSSGNHAAIGLYGAGAGALIAAAYDSKYGVKFNKIYAGDKLLDNLANAWNDNKALRPYLEQVVASLEGYNPTRGTADGWVGLPKDVQKNIVDRLENEIKSSEGYKISKDTEKYIHSLITAHTGAEAQMRLNSAKAGVEGLDLQNVLENLFSVTKSFLKDKVGQAFDNAKNIDANEYIKAMKRFNKTRSLAGVGIGAAIGMSIQPINRYLTKKRTGSDDFVGGGEKDNSIRFKVIKALAATAFLIGAFATISTNPKEILSKLQFKGMTPTLDQYKAVYGLTIFSRFLSSRNTNELGEGARKDTIGFISWLILGNIVAKAFIKAADKELLNYQPNKGILKANIKTRDEVLLEALNKHGIPVTDNGKAIKFSELMRKLPSSDKLTKVKLRKLNIAQCLGYLFSGLILGVGIPQMNKYITNSKEAKKKEARELEAKTIKLDTQTDTVSKAA